MTGILTNHYTELRSSVVVLINMAKILKIITGVLIYSKITSFVCSFSIGCSPIQTFLGVAITEQNGI